MSTTQISRTKAPRRQAWRSFRSEFEQLWEPGQHVSIMGRTGSGKSTIAAELCKMWRFVLAFDVKSDGSCPVGRKVKSYPSPRMLHRSGPQHYRLAPGYGAGAIGVFDDAFRKAWIAGKRYPAEKDTGSWVLYLDELKIMSDKLKLGDHIETMYIAGRSRGITMIGATQAPRDVPSDFYDQASYFFIGQTRDMRTLERQGEIIGDRTMLREVIPSLAPFEFYVAGPGDFARIVKVNR